MRCFLFYISEWKSSKQIARMDAAEERGYLRLLLDAAESPDCGLPDDDDELRTISLLKKQWFCVTQDEEKQYRGQTSGQKLRSSFFRLKNGKAVNAADDTPYIPNDDRHWSLDGLREGRIYNERLLREFRHQKAVNETKKKASSLGVDARKKKALADEEGFLEELERSGANDTSQPDPAQKEPEHPSSQTVTHVVNHMVDHPVTQTDNKLSLSLGLSLEESIAIASKFQTAEGFNSAAAFACLAKDYHPAGRVRLRMALGTFITRIDEAPGKDPVALFARMLRGLSHWNASDQWSRGTVNHICNWLTERLYDEHPVSAEEAQLLKRPARLTELPSKQSAMDRVKARIVAKEKRAS